MLARFTSTILLVLMLLSAAAQQPGPARPEPVGELAGTLVIAGGGTLPDGVRARFVELAGGKQAKLVIMADGDDALTPWKQYETAALQRCPTSDDKAIAEATGVWVAGDATKLPALAKVLARGGVVGGAVGALLPGAVVADADQLPALVQKRPGDFGLAIPARSAVVVKGRRLAVLGDGPATIIQAAGGGKPASNRALKAGEVVDLIALSRSAVARAQPAFPPAQPAPPRVDKGALIIGGGGGMSLDVWKRFVELAGGPDSLIIVVPTALDDPVPKEPGEVKALLKAGARNVKLLHTRDRAEANRPDFAAVLKDAKGVWFSGGRQWRFVDAYENTLTERGFHDVLARGGVIGGSSAGASIQSEYMPRGDPLGNLNIIAEGYERGFGFLKGAAVDQHFFVRKRTADMTQLMKAYPQLLGIGIDESTTIIVQGSVMEVVGKTKVAIYDPRKPAVNGQDYEEVPAGAKYDLVKRERVEAK